MEHPRGYTGPTKNPHNLLDGGIEIQMNVPPKVKHIYDIWYN